MEQTPDCKHQPTNIPIQLIGKPLNHNYRFFFMRTFHQESWLL